VELPGTGQTMEPSCFFPVKSGLLMGIFTIAQIADLYQGNSIFAGNFVIFGGLISPSSTLTPVK